MLDESHHILLLEDESAHAELVRRAFEMRGAAARLTVASSLAEARACLARLSAPPLLIIADWRLPDGDGLELLNDLPRIAAPVIIMTSQGNERVAVEAFKAGALDYVVKSNETLDDMPHIAERAIREWNTIAERERIRAALQQYNERLTILHEIDLAILSAKSIEEIAEAALNGLRRAMPLWRCQVILFDREAGEAYAVVDYQAGQKIPANWRTPLLMLGALAALAPGEVPAFDDLTGQLLLPPVLDTMRLTGARSSVNAPLIERNQQIGLLSLYAREPQYFSGETIQMMREVADQLAVAIQNANLLEQAQRHAQELELRVAERTRELAAANLRLTELDRLKSKFVSEVSHELRTPIANLNLHVELLERGRPEKREIYLTVVKQQAKRLGQLVDDILNLSRLEMSRHRPAFELVDFNDLIDQIVTAHQPRAESANLTLTFAPQSNLPAIMGEVNQLAQVVTNLVVNALNYTLAGSVRVSTRCNENEVCLAVEDSGIGIAPDDLPHIFDRFYRGQRTQRRETPGTGLGLAIVKEIVDLHEGRIEVESGVKQGATFKVWLPIVRPRI